MKNNLFKILFLVILTNASYADNLDIKAKNISIDKKNEITIFKEKVIIKNEDGTTIETDIAKYNKKQNFFILEGNVIVTDINKNKFISEKANYNSELKIFRSIGKTDMYTAEGYFVETESIYYSNNENLISSNNKTKITDIDENKIYLDNFNYLKDKNIFKSIGKIKVLDKNNNSYKFSQIYIDEKKKEIIGSDSKAFFNQDQLKLHKNNKPRIFSNTVSIKSEQSKFVKSTFTLCNHRKDDKCPPWVLSASEMRHDKKSKTIYYDNAVIKVYDIPIFYFPKLAHPDPTVDRRSGFLNPSFTDTKNLGSSVKLPYFWAIGEDRDLTLNNKLFFSEHPLFLGEYRQAFKNSDLIFDFGFTEGYKTTTATKKSGDKSHFFSKFVKNFTSNSEKIENNLEIGFQHVSNKKYLKLYRIDSNLVNYETESLENYFDFTHLNEDKNIFASFKANSFRTLADSYNDKYEFTIPEITFNKNILSDNLGTGNFGSIFKVHNYDTNKYKNFLINNLDWSYNKSFASNLYDGRFLANLKNVNYETNNVSNYKKDTNHEAFGAIGYLGSINLIKQRQENEVQLLKPKILLKYSPNHMRGEADDFSLKDADIFSLNRVQSAENFESGASLTVGLDYEINNNNSNEQINFSIGQIINEKKNNKKMPSNSSLDQRFSDVIGGLGYSNNNLNIDYNYSLDQNYKDVNFNEVNMDYNLNNVNFGFDYLEENKTSSPQEYIKSSLEVKSGNSGVFSFSNKRNLLTSSSEFYDLGYEYVNDCLRAGLVYRREFYNDSELEAENSLMFKITLSPFGSVNSPTFSN